MNQNDVNIPAAVGAAFGGGYFVGKIKEGEQVYALIMAGAAGEISGRWNASLDHVEGALSTTNGPANTQAMAAAGSKLATRILALEIGGHTDWYIPAHDELEMAYRAFKPSTTKNYSGEGKNNNSVPPGEEYTRESPAQTTVEALREDEPDALIPSWYWSSTQHAADADCAWNRTFDRGLQYNGHKSYAGRARAFRRLPI